MKTIITIALVLLLAGCASGPFKHEPVTEQQAIRHTMGHMPMYWRPHSSTVHYY